MKKSRLRVDDRPLAAIVTEIRRKLELVDAAWFAGRMGEYQRGGLPSDSIPERISGGSKGGTPTIDSFDVVLDGAEHRYREHLTLMAEELDMLISHQDRFAPPSPTHHPARYAVFAESKAKEAKVRRGPQATSCVNPACGVDIANTPVDRVRAGRCGACFEYRRRHGGTERPKELIEAAIYR